MVLGAVGKTHKDHWLFLHVKNTVLQNLTILFLKNAAMISSRPWCCGTQDKLG